MTLEPRRAKSVGVLVSYADLLVKYRTSGLRILEEHRNEEEFLVTYGPVIARLQRIVGEFARQTVVGQVWWLEMAAGFCRIVVTAGQKFYDWSPELLTEKSRGQGLVRLLELVGMDVRAINDVLFGYR